MSKLTQSKDQSRLGAFEERRVVGEGEHANHRRGPHKGLRSLFFGQDSDHCVDGGEFPSARSERSGGPERVLEEVAQRSQEAAKGRLKT